MLEADIEVAAMSDEVDERGYFRDRQRCMTTLRFGNVLNVRLDGFRFQNVLDAIEITEIDPAERDYRLCYQVGRNGERIGVTFGATSMGGSEHSLAFVEISEDVPARAGSIVCPAIDGEISVMVQGTPIQLGMQAAALESALKAEATRSGDTLTFEWARKALGPYKTIASGKDTIVTWDLITHVLAVAPEGRVRALSVGHSTTY